MSEKSEWLFRIDDILHSIDRIKTSVSGIDFAAYLENEDIRDIIDRRLQIIGDAAGKVPDEIKAKYSQMPWSKMIGLRNFVVHEYNGVNRRVIWDTVQKDPPLETDLRALLASERH